MRRIQIRLPRRRWKLVRYNTVTLRYSPPGDVDKEQRFWWHNSAQRAKEKLNYHHFLWKSPIRFEIAERSRSANPGKVRRHAE